MRMLREACRKWSVIGGMVGAVGKAMQIVSVGQPRRASKGKLHS